MLHPDRDLLCALLGERVETPAVTPEVIDVARDERLHLVLGHRWRLPALADELRAASALQAAREVELRTVLDALARVDVRAVLIKGESIAYTHYPRPELRPRLDTDLMIAPDRRDEAARGLVGLGYVRPSEVDGALVTSQFHFQRRDRSGLEYALDVHWRISNVLAFADAVAYGELARDAVPLPPLGDHAWGASPVHALLTACVHRVAHHAASGGLLWLYDIARLARGLDSRQRAAFVDLASTRKMRAVCAQGLQLAGAAFGGIDAAWMAELSGGAMEPAAAFLGGGLRQVDILKADLAAAPRWRDRLELLRQHVFPRKSFIYERYGIEQPLALPFLYLHRLVTGLPKWFRR